VSGVMAIEDQDASEPEPHLDADEGVLEHQVNLDATEQEFPATSTAATFESPQEELVPVVSDSSNDVDEEDNYTVVSWEELGAMHDLLETQYNTWPGSGFTLNANMVDFRIGIPLSSHVGVHNNTFGDGLLHPPQSYLFLRSVLRNICLLLGHDRERRRQEGLGREYAADPSPFNHVYPAVGLFTQPHIMIPTEEF